MLSYAFFYFVGQNITWLFSSWLVSLLVCATFPIVVMIVDGSAAVRATTVFIGWASVFFIPEFVLKIEHVTFHGDIKHQLTLLMAAFDMLIFVGISFAINVNDSSLVIWTMLLGAHVFYVWGIWYFNFYAKRVQDHHTFFATYMLVLIANDIYFLLVSLIVHGHPLNFTSVLIAGLLTAVPLLFLSRNEVFVNWVETHAPVPFIGQ